METVFENLGKDNGNLDSELDKIHDFRHLLLVAFGSAVARHGFGILDEALWSPFSTACLATAPPPLLQWIHQYSEPISLEAIRRQFPDPHLFRVWHRVYPIGTSFHGSRRAGLCFVLNGEAVISFQAGSTFILRDGQFADLPEGSYRFENIGSTNVEIVSVWDFSASAQWLQPGQTNGTDGQVKKLSRGPGKGDRSDKSI